MEKPTITHSNRCFHSHCRYSFGLIPFAGYAAIGMGLFSSICVASPVYSSKVLADNPVSYWRLGEGSGASVAIDQTGIKNGAYLDSPTPGNAGAIVGDPNTSIGLGGTMLSRVAMSAFTAFPTSELSVEYWMKSVDQSESGTAFSYAVPGTDNEFLLYDYQNLTVYINEAAISTGIRLTDGAFNHVVVNWKSSNGSLKVYKNGSLAFSGFHEAGNALTSGGTLILGQEQDSLGGSFETFQRFIGSLDEVAVYDHLLPADRILEHYRAGAFNSSVPEPMPFGAVVLAFASVISLRPGRSRL